ncbi:MAG: serine hydrolase domain-containing protein, partial [Myxococcota bacterium]
MTENRFAAVAREMPGWLSEFAVPSASVAVIEDDRIVWTKTFGRQTPTRAADDRTIYDIASLSKPVTAEVFFRLAAAGRVSLDDRMADYWIDPDLVDDPRVKRLTPRHVFTHTTGFPNWRGRSKLRFERDPGTDFGYSGEGFQFLIRYVERKLGQSYQSLAKEVLFTKAGMKNTAFSWQPWFRNRQAWPVDDDGHWNEASVVTEAMGASAVNTTTADYARFILAVAKGDDLPEAIRAERFRIAVDQGPECRKTAKMAPICPKKMGIALGWFVVEFDDETVIGHTGSNSRGERTIAMYSPTERWGFVIFATGATGDHLLQRVA